MGPHGFEHNGSGNLHEKIARRAASEQTRAVHGTEARDLALIAAVATLVPTAVVALTFGATPAFTTTVTLLTVVANVLGLYVLRTDYAVQFAARGLIPVRAGRWRRAALRVIPDWHRVPENARRPAHATLPRPGR